MALCSRWPSAPDSIGNCVREPRQRRFRMKSSENDVGEAPGDQNHRLLRWRASRTQFLVVLRAWLLANEKVGCWWNIFRGTLFQLPTIPCYSQGVSNDVKMLAEADALARPANRFSPLPSCGPPATPACATSPSLRSSPGPARPTTPPTSRPERSASASLDCGKNLRKKSKKSKIV